MLRHSLIVAWRAVARSPLYALVSIMGLAAGLCVAILCALIVRGEYSYDHFLQNYDDTYLCVSVLMPSGQPPVYNLLTGSALAGMLRSRFPEVGQVARLDDDSVELQNGTSLYTEKVYWADPNALEVLRLPLLAGDRALALSQPDSVVLTAGAARQMFGTQEAVGRYLQLNRTHRVRVTAVLKDLPAHQTELQSGIFLAGVAAYSKLSALDADSGSASGRGGFAIDVLTYLTLAPGASPEPLRRQMIAVMDAMWPHRPPGLGPSIEPLRVDRLHLFAGLNPGVQGRVTLVSLIGTLVLLVACINFVNLCVAQSGRRSMEVGIRKVTGASRGELLLHFVGESILYLLIAAAVAVALVELLLPRVNAFLDTAARFDYGQDPRVLAAIVGGALLLAVAAGFYPALVLASMRPTRALRGPVASSSTATAARQLMISMQFAVLCGLLIAAGVLYEQRAYVTRDALRAQTGQMLMIRSPCRPALLIELRHLPGVIGAACSGQALLDGQMFENLSLKTGGTLAIDIVPVGRGLLDLYGIRAVAGTFAFAADSTSAPMPLLVVNELAARRLGYDTGARAIDQPLQAPIFGPGPPETGRIIGVAADFSLNVLADRLKPTIYVSAPRLDALVSVRLMPAKLPKTLAQLQRIWTATGGRGLIDWFFVSQYFRDQYAKVLRQDALLGVFSVITLLLACFGLFALAAAIVERRTVEFGVRKAMGATSRQIFSLLLWQFSKPVLYGSLVAWPISAWRMERWLHGFAYHVDLQVWLFPLATTVALLMTWAAVSAHALRLSQAAPVAALRYE